MRWQIAQYENKKNARLKGCIKKYSHKIFQEWQGQFKEVTKFFELAYFVMASLMSWPVMDLNLNFGVGLFI